MTQFKKEDQSKVSASASNVAPKRAASNPLVETWASGKEVLNAEILWALKCVYSHYSYNSCIEAGKLFSAMFPDSSIAQQFSCSETKCRYLCQFGIAPHFQALLLKCVKDSEFYTLLFDETLNKSNQQKQLDILVRLWDPVENRIKTQYLNSAFLGHSTANDILSVFMSAVKDLDLSKLLQISMDGPAVNWKFYNELEANLKEEHSTHCINIGSCGLHIVNNAFKKGESSTEWNIESVLKSLYYLFHDAPARKEDFLQYSSELPLKFCSHRWLENVPVAERAILIWDNVKSYINAVQIGKHEKISCKSFSVLLEATKDTLFIVKLNFFLSVAELVTPFLELYQGESPLLPFFATDIQKFVKNCFQLFNVIKPENAGNLNSIDKLCKFNFADDSYHQIASKVSLGFKADKILRQLLNKKEITDKDHFSLKKESKNFVIIMLSKLLEKCPINYSIVRNAVCLDPKFMIKNKKKCNIKMKNILIYLSQRKKILDKDCDEIKLQFSEFLDIAKENSIQFQEFDPSKQRLDTFLGTYLSEKKFSKLWNVAKMLMTLSHGQASVERGFSLNKKIEIENRKASSYVAQRLIYDYIKNAGGILNVVITKELRVSAASAHSKYRNYLEEQKKLENTNERKRKMEEDVAYIKQKKLILQKDYKETSTLVDELTSKAEELKDIDLFIKSNKLRKSLTEKKEKIVELDKDIVKIMQNK